MVSSKTQVRGGGGELIPIHSLKRNPSERNPNDVLTTCKAIRKGLADLCTDHAHYVKNHRPTVLRENR